MQEGFYKIHTRYIFRNRYGKWPSIENTVENAYKNTIYELDELLDTIYAKVNGLHCHWEIGKACLCYNNTNLLENICYIHFEKLDTLYNGRCYVFNLTHNVSAVRKICILS